MSSSPASAAELEPEVDDAGGVVAAAVINNEFLVEGNSYICTLNTDSRHYFNAMELFFTVGTVLVLGLACVDQGAARKNTCLERGKFTVSSESKCIWGRLRIRKIKHAKA